MGVCWAIFKRDALRILRNPIALAVTLGICVVPCLYAWINVLANWDPYQNTSDMPVAVVNEDRPVELADMGEICAGELMVEALGENDSIGWQFVGEEEALEGVRGGTYYAAIVIPGDFTAHLTGILDGKTEKAQLRYYVNEKVNAIAPKVADTGATTIENQVKEKFTSVVGKVIAEKLGDAVGGVVDKSKAAVGKAATALGDAHTTLVDVDANLGELSVALTSARTSLADAAKDLSSLEGVGTELAGRLDGALGNVGQVRSDANQLMARINDALGNAAGGVSSISSRASTDVASLTGDVLAAQSQLNAAIRALENDLTDNEGLEARLTTARSVVLNADPEDESARITLVEIERELSSQINIVVELSDAQRAKLDELRGIAEQLRTTVSEVGELSDAINSKAQTTSDALSSAQTTNIGTSLQQVGGAVDTFVQVAQQLETAARAVDPIVSQAVTVAQNLSDTLAGTSGALDGTRASLAEVAQRVSELSRDLAAVQASDAWSLVKELFVADPEAVREFLSEPVQVNTLRIFPVENYASGVAPFFTSVALWVGGIALVAIFKLEVDEEKVGKTKPWQAYFGRWLLFVSLGALQAVVCATGDLAIGVQCVHPWAFYLSAVVASFAFVNVIFALSVAFKHLGKALAFTLIILQVPGSAGMYPIEMMPPFFQAINPWLPFTYSNNALREAVAGFYEADLAKDLLMLLLFVVPSILVGVTARSRLVNINALFDKRLRETDHLMVSEPVAIEGNRHRLATVVKALHAPDEYRAEFEARSAGFQRAYPHLVRRGVAALFVVPLALFVLLLVTDAKLPLIACWVAALVLIYAFLILVEYFHDRVQNKRALTDLSREELEGVLVDTLHEEFMPYAPIDAILARRHASHDEPQEEGDAQ